MASLSCKSLNRMFRNRLASNSTELLHKIIDIDGLILYESYLRTLKIIYIKSINGPKMKMHLSDFE